MITRVDTDINIGLDERRLSALLEAAVRRARLRRRPILASVVLPVQDCDPLAAFAAVTGERRFWSCPSEGYELAGLGAAWKTGAHGGARFAEARRRWRELLADALVDGGTLAPATGPLLLAGFAFDPRRARTPLWDGFPDAELALPRLLLSRVEHEFWLTINVVVEPAGTAPPVAELLDEARALIERAGEEVEPAPAGPPLEAEDLLPAAQWGEIVRSAVRQLGDTGMEKVVLARACETRAERVFDPAAALARLRTDYPGCFVYGFDTGTACFLGASPERLVSLRRGTVWATCLAGSIARGATPEEDRHLGETLLESGKDRAEHAVVVRALRDSLANVTESLTVPPEPTLMKVRNVQHLFTPVVGTVVPGTTVLDLVERLHPTPAVGGYPREAALALIREEEQLDRGWYAGPIGWLDADGDGEFAVALRCGLLRGRQATLFAGCGIVADSDPEREYVESRLKLRPVLSALGGSF